MKVGIIGAGLGGLLTAASLSRKGYDVEVFEKLPYPGGRFTNFDYKGYQLSTGALHMIPHSSYGPLGTMIKELGLHVEIVDSKPQAMYRIDGKDYEHREVPGLFSVKDKIKVLALLSSLQLGKGGDETFRELLKRKLNNKLAFQISDAFLGWSISLDSSEISSREMFSIARNIRKLKGPGIPMGGCKGITDALVEEIKNNGGGINLKSTVNKIKAGNGKAESIIIGDEEKNFDIIISNTGPKSTANLAREHFNEEYIRSMNHLKGAPGIKISIACEKPMLGHSGVLLTCQTERVHGLNEVTNTDPSLAPKDKHLLMAHQAYKEGMDVKNEIQLGLADLKKLFPDFERHCKVLMVQTYRYDWPVNKTPSGKYIGVTTPLKGLYNVGDGIKPEGWMETDGVAAGVELALKDIEENN